MKMDNKIFDIIRFIGEVVLPALGALYFGVARIWGLPYGEMVVGTIACVTTAVGAIVGFSRKKYEDSQKPPIITNI